MRISPSTAVKELEQARLEGCEFAAKLAETDFSNSAVVWRLPAHPQIGSNCDAQNSLPIEDGYIELVNSKRNQELEAQLSVPARKPHLDVLGPTGSGKTCAVYMAILALMQKRPNVRVLYIADCKEWRLLEKEKEPCMLFLLKELMRAFARDEIVVKKLELMVRNLGYAWLTMGPLIFHWFAEWLVRHLKETGTVLYVVVDAANNLNGLEKVFPFSCIEYLGSRCQVRVVRCGSTIHALHRQHSREWALWQQWAIEGGFEEGVLSKLCKRHGLPFDSQVDPDQFRRVCKVTGGNSLELKRFATAWKALELFLPMDLVSQVLEYFTC